METFIDLSTLQIRCTLGSKCLLTQVQAVSPYELDCLCLSGKMEASSFAKKAVVTAH